MTPFEDLIHSLSPLLGIPLEPDAHQSCLIVFPNEHLSCQIDLDINADRILIGSELGQIPPGSYREKIFLHALIANGASRIPRGILAFSEKNDSLVLYQFLDIAPLTGDKLFQFLTLYLEQARTWQHALERGDIPPLPEITPPSGSGMYGLKP